MGSGKLETRELERVVFPHFGVRRREVVLRAAVGEDSCALDLGGDLVVMTTDPITGADKDGGWLAVQVSCNDLVSNGAEPVAVLLTVMLKDGSGADQAGEIMASAHRAARELEIEIIGGHTEITAGLNMNIISVTAIGRADRKNLLKATDVMPGDQMVLTKGAGIEGTAIFCLDYPEACREILGDRLLEQGQGMARDISVVPEARLAASLGVHAMHDVTEGGILGAAFEMGRAAGLGIVLERERILIRESTGLLCRELSLDPLKLISSGSLLIASPEGENLVRELGQAGIPAEVVGRFTTGDQMILRGPDGDRPIGPPAGDELWPGRARLARWFRDAEEKNCITK